MTRNAAEFKLHAWCVGYLYGQFGKGKGKLTVQRPFPELFDRDGSQRFTTIFQGRSKKEGGMLKALGLRPGVLDMLFWPPQGLLWMDFKVNTRLSKAQETFIWAMQQSGIPSYTPRSCKEFSGILLAHGLKRAHDLIVEPDLASWEEKLARVDDYFRP